MELKKMFVGISPTENSDFTLFNGRKPFAIHDKSDVLNEGNIIVLFANIHNDTLIPQKIEQAIDENFVSNENIEEQLMSCYSDLCSIVEDDIVARLIMMNNINGYIAGHKKKIRTIKEEVLAQFRFLSFGGDTFAEVLSNGVEEDDVRKWMLLDAYFNFGKKNDIFYQVVPGFTESGKGFAEVYIINNARAAIYFDVVQTIKKGIQIKRCQNCNKYFVPLVRSDEIYCDNIFENGKTCKQLGYENKVKKDKVLSQYRKIYKTQNARKQRNSHIPNIDERFKGWAAFAKKQLELCQSGKQSLESMTAAISGDSWMKEGAINADDPETR